jgi:hypothetical protein
VIKTTSLRMPLAPVEPGHFDAKTAIAQQHSALQHAVLAVAFAALAMGIIALAATPGLTRVERATENARV